MVRVGVDENLAAELLADFPSEAEIVRLATKDEGLEQRIGALESREDEVYRRWRDEYHELRYRVPSVTRLFHATFQITAPNPEKSC